MKIKIFVALIATATIIFLSCNWFRSKKKESANPLIGEWKLDSVKAEKDTNFVYFLLASAVKDSNSINFSFTKDSIYTYSKDDVATIAYSFDKKLNQVNIEDSSKQALTFVKLNGSLISLSTKDSTIFFIQKK